MMKPIGLSNNETKPINTVAPAGTKDTSRGMYLHRLEDNMLVEQETEYQVAKESFHHHVKHRKWQNDVDHNCYIKPCKRVAISNGIPISHHSLVHETASVALVCFVSP